MKYLKITHGRVVQIFNDVGECIGQYFHTGDVVEYETETGNSINPDDMPLAGREYRDFTMIQPVLKKQP